MPAVEQKDFIARVVAENQFKIQLREANGEYEPPNFYGNFLKRQIEELQNQRKDSIDQGNKIKLNSKFFRKLFYSVWQQKLSEGVRRLYREQQFTELPTEPN